MFSIQILKIFDFRSYAYFLSLIVLLVGANVLSLVAEAKLSVVTTTSDMAALVEAVGGKQVKTFSVAKGTQDPHHIEAKPSFMVRFHNADLVVAQGLELESAWLIPLIEGARNPKIFKGTQGFLELGEKIDPLEVPKGEISRADGDVHASGNPHFQLDPLRIGKAALLVANRLGELDPGHREEFLKNANSFQTQLEEKSKVWQERIEATGVKEIVTHHKTFIYFCHRFHIKCDIQLEPKPGIPPTASHLLSVIQKMKERKLKLVLIENYFDDDSPDKLKTQVPLLHVERVPVSVGGEPSIKNLPDLYERLVAVFEKAVKK